ncbi:MAG: TrmO family methyltransferase domain-containing protein, partial [Sedimenticolaceae bacterium]
MSKQSPKDSYVIHPIGRVESPYAEKFGTPRQPGLVKAALGKLCLSPDYAKAEALEGLEGFSHLWV